MNFLSTLGGKIAGGVIALAVVAAGVSWVQADPSTRHEIMQVAGRITGWFVVVLLLPWALFWLIGMIARMQSNAAGVMLILSLTIVEAVTLAWLFGFSIHGGGEWVMFFAGVLMAGVYNLFSSDWIAEKVE